MESPADPRVLVPTLALVDSGSDFTAFPMRLGTEIGFTYDAEERPKTGYGIGSMPFDFWPATNTVTVQSEIGPMKIECPLLTRGSRDYPVLGRADFFRQFVVKFDERSAQMEFEPYEKARPH